MRQGHRNEEQETHLYDPYCKLGMINLNLDFHVQKEKKRSKKLFAFGNMAGAGIQSSSLIAQAL